MVKTIYIYLDESGNFDFSPTGTKYLVLTCFTTQEPLYLAQSFNNLKYSFIKNGLEVKYFHATEDLQDVRNKVFGILHSLNNYELDSIIIEKSKTNPTLHTVEKLYPKMCSYLLQYIFRRIETIADQLIIFTDKLPLKKKRKAVEKAFKKAIKEFLPHTMPFHVFHHESMSDSCLQAADYCGWAIYKKWTEGELRPYQKVAERIQSEFDIFQRGTIHYYKIK